jgi:hypothetical protein
MLMILTAEQSGPSLCPSSVLRLRGNIEFLAAVLTGDFPLAPSEIRELLRRRCP